MKPQGKSVSKERKNGDAEQPADHHPGRWAELGKIGYENNGQYHAHAGEQETIGLFEQ